MEVLPDPFGEYLQNNVSGVYLAHLLDNLTQLVNNLVLIFGKHQVRDLTSVKNAAYILKERLIDDLTVSQSENSRSGLLLFFFDTGSLEHDLLNEIAEVRNSVVFLHLYLLVLDLVNRCCELGQTLLARTTDTDEHQVATRLS